MCCIFPQIVKYVYIFTNLLLCLASVALIGLGITVIGHVGYIEFLHKTAILVIPISVIVLGSAIFLVAFFGCSAPAAIRQSKWFLLMYPIIWILLAAGKIYLSVVLFQGLNNIYNFVEDWNEVAFNNNKMRQLFHQMEASFRCCGTTGPEAYIGILPALPWSCCETSGPDNTCSPLDAYMGCNDRIGSYFEAIGGAIAGVVIALIVFEVVAIIFGFIQCSSADRKKRTTVLI